MAVYIVHHKDEAPSLLKYMFNIREPNKQIGLAWRTYDVQFRLRQEVSPAPWALINTDLWWRCSLSRDNVPSSSETVRGRTGNSYPCIDFNKGSCAWPVCRFAHVCSRCGAYHQPHHASAEIHWPHQEARPFFFPVQGTGLALTEGPVMANPVKQDPCNFDLSSIAPTPVNFTSLSRAFAAYENRVDADIILDGFANGFKLHYSGPRLPRDSDNLKSAEYLSVIVKQKNDKKKI
ncbi:hypothetical protein DPMN_163300 [Dreissena polymorpha]|uniref:C3H1-type domain-containing protein n=1 Tax=Dreissena polymorpha TaxID=45954 RepID=A0A9D4ERS0_DREPO|nr:hypothetical protein DPMN_163300 [Dreissena polymorpha]